MIYIFGITDKEGHLRRVPCGGESEITAFVKFTIENWKEIQQKGIVELYGEMENE